MKAAFAPERGPGAPGIFEYLNSSPGWRWTFALFLVVVTVLVYFPALNGGFVWDDDSWTTGISGLLRDTTGLRLMWFEPAALQQYYPLSGTSFWLDYQLWKLQSLPYHVENVLWHALAAVLFWRLLLRLQVRGAALASAIFALHPVMVESVAWITERKNVLSLFFYLAALLAYERYARWAMNEDGGGSAVSSPRRTWHRPFFYGLAFFLFLCALLAKTTAFSLPAVILLIAWWKREKIRWPDDVLPTLPFFAVALGLCLATAWLEKHNLGAQGPEFALTFPQRCLVAGRVFWFYAGKLFWPTDLCFIYPRWQPNPALWWQWLYPMTAMGALAALWLARKRIGRGPCTAIYFYAGTLFPVLGFMNAYGMRYSFVWDHWVYLSALGIITLMAGLIFRAAEYLHKPAAAFGFGVIVLATLGFLTWRQCAIYSKTETLWRVTLARNPAAWMAHNNLGILLFKEGEIDQAIVQFRQALDINPADPDAQNNLGDALFIKGRWPEAIDHLQRALVLRPDYWQAEQRLCDAYLRRGQVADAIAQYRTAISLEPNNAYLLNNLAWLLATYPDPRFRSGQEAVTLARYACYLTDYRQPELLGTLAAAYAETGRFEAAIATSEKVHDLVITSGQHSLDLRNQELLRLFRARQPYREQPGQED